MRVPQDRIALRNRSLTRKLLLSSLVLLLEDGLSELGIYLEGGARVDARYGHYGERLLLLFLNGLLSLFEKYHPLLLAIFPSVNRLETLSDSLLLHFGAATGVLSES